MVRRLVVKATGTGTGTAVAERALQGRHVRPRASQMPSGTTGGWLGSQRTVSHPTTYEPGLIRDSQAIPIWGGA